MAYSYLIATALITNDSGECLMLMSKKIGKWSLPGGKVELGEQPRETAVREVKEEAGIDIDVSKLVGFREFYWEADAAHWTELIYQAVIKDGEPKVMEPEKITTLEWRPVTDIPEDAQLISLT